eukprot:TRINITY_DN2928_c0_g1_i3.p3 TRINITY_DN2928_c0_g1~~TRINITY_DN2928_c0_g1_i3.p3  ORF type:complete len:127 (+),score=28.70 TRINITY_DN2928_c0_g1_i3:43-423(+)
MEQSDQASKVLGEGLHQLFEPIVREMDQKVGEVTHSQTQLLAQIDQLSASLQRFSELAQTPALAPHVQKLANARRRILAVNGSLRTIRARLDGMQQQVAEQRARRAQQYPRSVRPSGPAAGAVPPS